MIQNIIFSNEKNGIIKIINNFKVKEYENEKIKIKKLEKIEIKENCIMKYIIVKRKFRRNERKK